MATIYPQTQAVSRPRAARRLLTLEQLLYLAIGVFAVLLHLYALGGRALHHDETLHAQFSWRIYTGQGYTHDPLLHGPFLYYITAAMYLLFGDTDATARLSAALFGIGLTFLPMLLRRELGRGGALLASAYLLISPVALYVGRFIRHDIYAVVFEVLMVIGLVRYVKTERPGWHYLLAAAAALMLTTMETFYLFLLIWGSFVGIWLLWQVSRQALALVGGYILIAALALKGLPRIASIGVIPLVSESDALSVRHQPDNQWGVYFRKMGGVIAPLFRHPAILLLLLATVLLLVGLVVLVFVRRDQNGQTAWQRAWAGAEPGTLVYAVGRIPGRQWLRAFLLAFAIYAVFYTGFLSNVIAPNVTGVVTGITGSFLYWLGQHGVRRGGQPAHYYLFQIMLYEPLLLLGGFTGIVLTLRRLLRLRKASVATDEEPAETVQLTPLALREATHDRLFLPALLVWWTLGALAIYSWAGEKMPWLTIHMVVPLALLSAWGIARAGAWVMRQRPGQQLVTLVGVTLAFGLLCLIQLNTTSQALADKPEQIGRAWLWPLMFGLLVVIATLAGALLGPRQEQEAEAAPRGSVWLSGRGALFVGLSVALITLVPYTIRSSLRLSFQNGDTAVEPLVFVQSSPDIARLMEQLERAKLLYGSARPFEVRYDNETIWSWYLRKPGGTPGSGSATIGQVPEEVQAVFLLQENVQANEEYLDEFVAQKYPLRWWLPECDVYRFPATDKECGPNPGGNSLFSRFVTKPFDGQTVVDWWRFAIYRKVPNPLGSSDFTLFVRPAVAPMFGLSPVPEP